MFRQQLFLPLLPTLAACIVTLSGCAPAVPVQRARLTVPADPQITRVYVVQQQVIVRLSSSYERRIADQSRWRVIGTLPQGQVFKPVDAVFTIEGRQIHEAWLVVKDGRLTGFYLPGEEHFSPLAPSVSLTFGEP
ncbi:hypothetical protein B0G69_1355 [Paraburkholderia sp. RAU2J]|uniref:hypothetical protein n=1 Tax=Paraburkholderia sp. RAU2J TaxID=1938810 RepID=UPI000EB0F793|nr:hypothetical protein [Paraburkholderia sp. RAU2J]RKT25635.1 hypothetical protein B0G69_1355 [Paraburkholderia sp. RAU2J]